MLMTTDHTGSLKNLMTRVLLSSSNSDTRLFVVYVFDSMFIPHFGFFLFVGFFSLFKYYFYTS